MLDYLQWIHGRLIVWLFIADPTTQASQGEAPGKCQLSGKQGLAINRRCQGALWDGCSREEERGAAVGLKTCRTHGRIGERIEFPWQPEWLLIASQRQKPTAKFDISILKFWDINIILTEQTAILVIGSQRRTEPRCPCGLDEAASLRRELRHCGHVRINLDVETMTHCCRISSWKHVSGLQIAPRRTSYTPCGHTPGPEQSLLFCPYTRSVSHLPE